MLDLLPIDILQKEIFNQLIIQDLSNCAFLNKKIKKIFDDEQWWKQKYLHNFSHYLPPKINWKLSYFELHHSEQIKITIYSLIPDSFPTLNTNSPIFRDIGGLSGINDYDNPYDFTEKIKIAYNEKYIINPSELFLIYTDNKGKCIEIHSFNIERIRIIFSQYEVTKHSIRYVFIFKNIKTNDYPDIFRMIEYWFQSK